MRCRITVRGSNPKVELRGYIDDFEQVQTFAHALEHVWGTEVMVMASPADDDYNPFEDWSH